MALREVSDVIDEYTGLSRKVLEWGLTTKRLVDRAKQPGFTAESWAPIEEMVAVDEFERVGNFKEVMNWNEYVEFLTKWAPTSEALALARSRAVSFSSLSSAQKKASRPCRGR